MLTKRTKLLILGVPCGICVAYAEKRLPVQQEQVVQVLTLAVGVVVLFLIELGPTIRGKRRRWIAASLTCLYLAILGSNMSHLPASSFFVWLFIFLGATIALGGAYLLTVESLKA